MDDWYAEDGTTPFPEGTEVDYNEIGIYLPDGTFKVLNSKPPIGFDLSI